MTEKRKLEREYKLKSQNNIQLKVSGKTDPSLIISGLIHFSKAAGFASEHIEKANAAQPNRRDIYFDTDDRRLRAAGISLRKRFRMPADGAFEITIKKSLSAEASTGQINRDEVTIDIESGGSLKAALAKTQIGEEISNVANGFEELSEIAEIFNRRDKLRLKHPSGLELDLCFDRYYFANLGDYSEYNYEIEAEILNGSDSDNNAYTALLELLKGIEHAFEFSPNPISKVDQAVSWLHSHGDRHLDVHFFGFDIVGYTKLDSRTQLSVVQRINKTTKDILQRSAIFPDDISVVIPTGDGIVAGFVGYQKHLLPTVIELHRTISEQEAYFSKAKIRSAIHYGPVFRFTDMTENLSLAGKGINDMFRILNLPDADQIFISKEAKDVTCFNDGMWDSFFLGPHEVSVKHGQVIEYFNVYKEQYVGKPI